MPSSNVSLLDASVSLLSVFSESASFAVVSSLSVVSSVAVSVSVFAATGLVPIREFRFLLFPVLLASLLFGALYPLVVLAGVHLSFVPLMLDSISKTGVDYIMPLMSIAHCGLAGAALCIFIKTKNQKFKSVAATGALVTCIMVDRLNLQNRWKFIAK